MSDLSIVVEMIEKKQGLNKNGTIKLAALSTALGREIEAAERDSLEKQARQAIEEKKKKPAPAPTRSFGVNNSGLGSW